MSCKDQECLRNLTPGGCCWTSHLTVRQHLLFCYADENRLHRHMKNFASMPHAGVELI